LSIKNLLRVESARWQWRIYSRLNYGTIAQVKP
jgi:hypothetical protein